MMVTASPSTPPTTVAVTIARGIALPLESRTQPKKGTPVSAFAPQLSDSSLKKSPPLANAGSEINALATNPSAATLLMPIHDFIFISASSGPKRSRAPGMREDRNVRHYIATARAWPRQNPAKPWLSAGNDFLCHPLTGPQGAFHPAVPGRQMFAREMDVAFSFAHRVRPGRHLSRLEHGKRPAGE